MPADPVTPRPGPRLPEAGEENRARRLKQTCFSHRHDITLGGLVGAAAGRALSTGFDALDDHLPGGGWPLGALTEILFDGKGPGCLWLALPALAVLSRRQQWVAMIAPPLIPYAPALAAYGMDISKILLVHPRATRDALWAVEEALGSQTCSSALFWLSGSDNQTLRRLQLAAERSGTLGFCFRPARYAGQRTTAALRLASTPADEGAVLDILKVRGGRSYRGIHVRPATIDYD
jgi:protein ImuA